MNLIKYLTIFLILINFNSNSLAKNPSALINEIVDEASLVLSGDGDKHCVNELSPKDIESDVDLTLILAFVTPAVTIFGAIVTVLSIIVGIVKTGKDGGV